MMWFSSISIACWIVVFTPQIVENFRRSSADGLSLVFLVTWLLGDVFNILGAVLQDVKPTMILLAVYYTVADIILLAQCFFYRGFTLSDAPYKSASPMDDESAIEEDVSERSPLISHESHADNDSQRIMTSEAETPRHDKSNPTTISPQIPSHSSILGSVIYNASALIIVCLAGGVGWYLSIHHTHSHSHPSSATRTGPLHIDIWGQIFGYLCAVLYLGSRVPQLLLNHRRKSTEGVSALFFLFACVGNLTYDFSIFAYEPSCARVVSDRDGGFCERGEWGRTYARYVLVNASWILGSVGTLGLDLMIFAQFFRYRVRKA